jgi:hypothetical protein
VRKSPSFPSNRSPKNAGTIYFNFGGWFGVSQKSSENALRRLFGGFFHQLKERQQIEREDSLQAVRRRMRRFEVFLYERAKNVEHLKKLIVKIKKFKQMAENVRNLGQSNGISFRQI